MQSNFKLLLCSTVYLEQKNELTESSKQFFMKSKNAKRTWEGVFEMFYFSEILDKNM